MADDAGSLAWMESFPLPAWVVGEDGRITQMNDAARSLLGDRDQDPIGRPCHGVVAGKLASGERFCCSHCPVVAQAAEQGRVDVFDLDVDTPQGAHRLEVAVGVVPSHRGRGFRLLHLAKDVNRRENAERFVERLAVRSSAASAGRPGELLSQRELQVLRMMSEDATLESIASRLGVRYSTVRNHVQHILTKLDAHSMLEAVARYVLEDESR